MPNNALWLAIYDLYELLNDAINEEKAYQTYFESHPIIFAVLGYDKFAPFDQQSPHKLPYDDDREYTPKPDFICGKSLNGEITVLELKTPFQPSTTTNRSDGNRKKFKAAVEAHISQATEYVDSIRERDSARKVVCDALQISKISSYKILIPYGMSTAEDAQSTAKLTDNRKIPTEIIAYDVLLSKLIDHYCISRSDNISRNGWCYNFHLIIAPKQIHEKAYIFDVGSLARDRVSLYVEHDNLTLECIDTTGHTHKFPSALKTHNPLYVRFEFSNDESGAFITLNIDNEEVGLTTGTKPLEISPNFSSAILGSDLKESNGACFQTLEHYVYSKTLDIYERLVLFHYFKRKTADIKASIEFDGSSSMKLAAN